MSVNLNPLIKVTEARMAAYLQDPIKFSSYGKDLRTDQDKAYDLIEGWFFEELLLVIINSQIQSHGYVAKIEGCDADRVIQLKDTAITAEPDISIFDSSGALIKTLELKTAHKWFKDLNIKEANHKSLIDRSNSSLLFWGLESNEVCLINKEDFVGKVAEPNKAWKDKLCYTFSKFEMQTKTLGLSHRVNWLDVIGVTPKQALG